MKIKQIKEYLNTLDEDLDVSLALGKDIDEKMREKMRVKWETSCSAYSYQSCSGCVDASDSKSGEVIGIQKGGLFSSPKFIIKGDGGDFKTIPVSECIAD